MTEADVPQELTHLHDEIERLRQALKAMTTDRDGLQADVLQMGEVIEALLEATLAEPVSARFRDMIHRAQQAFEPPQPEDAEP